MTLSGRLQGASLLRLGAAAEALGPAHEALLELAAKFPGHLSHGATLTRRTLIDACTPLSLRTRLDSLSSWPTRKNS